MILTRNTSLATTKFKKKKKKVDQIYEWIFFFPLI